MAAKRLWAVYVYGVLVDTIEAPIESSVEDVIDHLVIDMHYSRDGLEVEPRAMGRRR